MLNMSNVQFQPRLPDVIGNFPQECSNAETATCFTDVGIMLLTSADERVVKGWNLLFLLENCAIPKYGMHLKSLRSRRFGRVIHRQMLEGVNKLSMTNKSERAGCTLSLESR